MFYQFSHDRYNDFKYYKDNILEPRAYFIPFSSRVECDKTTYLNERYNSSIVSVLSGDWEFKYYPKLTDLPLNMDTYFEVFDKIKVPSCWQFIGYEKPFYVNQKYQFDCHPPKVPADTAITGINTKLDNGKKKIEIHNSLGLYRKTFKIKRTAKHILTFFGAASNIQVYLNGRYVGYSEGSHNTAEFDVSGYITDGENELIVLVYKWCNGTYLEAQDMFRNNGIFRDVIVTSYGKNRIYDFECKTKQELEKWILDVQVKLEIENGATLRYTLLDTKQKEIEVKNLDKDEPCSFVLDKPLLWSAETPNLYMLYIEILKSGKSIHCVRQEVGFRKIEIKGNIFKFNNKKIKLLGVNHHDSHPEKGFAVTLEDYALDAKLMKEYNVNAVRTSHYPPDPAFLKMANYYGLYVVDEADIETHGVCAKKIYQINLISNNIAWREHYFDRVYRMYMRDRNNPSVTMWSLGNEAGGIKCQDYCYTRLKELTEIPIHYEGAVRTRRVGYDVVSEMYTAVERVEKVAKGKYNSKYLNKPFFLCEYAHAMGVGPGNLSRYTDAFYSGDIAMGGCIWEWCDHAVKHQDGTYTYGGDHDEWVHDGNFCVDGLFYPDRRPHTGALAMKHAYRPITARYVSNNKYALFNRRFFADTQDITIKWEYTLNGIIDTSGEIKASIQPHSEYEATIKHPVIDTTKVCAINFIYLAKDGHEIASEQIELCAFIDIREAPVQGVVAFIEEQNKVNIVSDYGRIVFDKATGDILSYNVGEVEFLTEKSSVEPNIYTAAIDNYMYVNKRWIAEGFENVEKEFISIDGEKQRDRVVITVENRLKLKGEPRFNYTIQYVIFSDCSMDVHVIFDSRRVYDMPRYGTIWIMNGKFKNVTYYGMGGHESYSDLKGGAKMGIYEFKRENMVEDYIRPQENGNRSRTIWASIKDEKGNGLKFIAIEKPLDFKVMPYTLASLRKAKHIEEIEKTRDSIVCLDGFVRGVGTNSCGEDALKEYRKYSGERFEYSYSVIPELVKENK